MNLNVNLSRFRYVSPRVRRAVEAAGGGDWSPARLLMSAAEREHNQRLLLDEARLARERYEAGEDPVLSTPQHVAAEIVSYGRVEPPHRYAALIRDALFTPEPLWAYYSPAAMVMMQLLETPSGLPMRTLFEEMLEKEGQERTEPDT